MKLSKLICVPLVLAALVCVSCIDPINVPGTGEDPLGEGNVYAYTMANKPYRLFADQIYEGEYCIIWAERSANITTGLAQSIANEYDNNIYSKIVDAFGMKNFEFTYLENTGTTVAEKTERFDTVMDFAGWWVTDGEPSEKDKKLTILLLDIKDDYNPPRVNSYTAGYFIATNFLDDYAYDSNGNLVRTYSNHRNMIYVDTYPGLVPDVARDVLYQTLAHELQHLINFLTTLVKRSAVENNTFRIYSMDTWIDEGLSGQAEFLYLDKTHAQDRVNHFNDDPSKTIAQGNNFYVWNDRGNSTILLDEYATVYLFFQWLYQQSDKDADIFFRIETSQHSDYEAVTDAVTDTISGNWEDLLKNWFTANYLKSPNGIYGYRDDNELNAIHIKPVTARNKQVTLLPGEGVYSVIDTTNYTLPTIDSRNPHIKYAKLTKAAQNILLTFNDRAYSQFYDTTPAAELYETGKVTGSAADISAPKARVLAQTSARAALNNAPKAVDARSFMGWNGETKLFGFPIKTK